MLLDQVFDCCNIMISYFRLMTLCGDFQPQANKVSPYDINNSSKWVFVHCAHLFPYQELSHSLVRVDNSKIFIVALIISGLRISLQWLRQRTVYHTQEKIHNFSRVTIVDW